MHHGTARQYLALANQTGVIVGSYVCAFVVGAGAFAAKEQ